jgi:site-specific recombinase XerD
LGLAPNTIDAYGRALEDYLLFSEPSHTEIDFATREHVAAHVRDQTSRPNRKTRKVVVTDSGAGLANAAR